ncbi:hypothetical protein LD125_00201 [Mesoplasma sp. JKS002658]|uniref:hypothetical protein n=1 Tax=Mesoplasma whartonense TaxID=2878854 RepID=UPI002022A3FD|nr:MULTISPECIES: hypothetical protein [unclassified Mesoplasma]MCL8211489.1 hypothetical protein [Mesoplasma sp. JKS002664]MCL8211949.1 hypothetical protein [Mesoplasma sp. JKS002662]MCL8213569.1 hypothetical protein [Mesoplasma sp. JKS002660]MCL8213946.1 hypothetical protein [Mesoplasma sp. JKS002658]MCL8214912.1 hypothetical protein [Mesoplasma sp. JKS002663]
MNKKKTTKPTKPSNRINFNQIIFPDKNYGKAFFVVGIVFCALAFVGYIDLSIALGEINNINWLKIDSLNVTIHIKQFTIISAVVSFVCGWHSSLWFILAFATKPRLSYHQEFLKATALFTFNFLAFFCLIRFLKKINDPKETINSIILTDIYYYKKQNWVWVYVLKISSVISMVFFSPFMIVSIYLFLEIDYALLKNSDIRDKIALASLSFFATFFFISIPFLVYTFKDRQYLSWMLDYDEEYLNTVDALDKNIKINKFLNWGLDLLILLTVLWIFVIDVLMINTFSPDSMFSYHYAWIYLLCLFSFITSAFCLGVKKYFLESNLASPLWVGIVDLLTLNIFFCLYSMIFTLRANFKDNNRFKIINKKLNLLMINTLMINAILLFGLVIALICLIQLDVLKGWKIGLVFSILSLTLLWLILNLGKVRDYKVYLLKLNSFFWIDCCTLNVVGIITNLVAWGFKKNLVKQQHWI